MAMILTHIASGMLLGAIISYFYGDYTLLLSIIGGLFGGIPDLDALFKHRKTLHFPIISIILLTLAMLAVLLQVLIIDTITFSLIIILTIILSLNTHYLFDYLAYGNVLRPWLGDESEEGLYNHIKGSWISSKNFYYYGSRLDLMILIFLTAGLNFYSSNLIIRIISILLIICGFIFYWKKKFIVKYL